jgi:hypothetical protein
MLILEVGTVCTILLAWRKWGWLDWYETYRLAWMPDGDCWLCLGLWLGLVVLVPAAILVGWWAPLLAFPGAALVATIMNLNVRK